MLNSILKTDSICEVLASVLKKHQTIKLKPKLNLNKILMLVGLFPFHLSISLRKINFVSHQSEIYFPFEITTLFSVNKKIVEINFG